MKILRTARLGSKFTGFCKKESVSMLPSILEPSRLLRNLPPLRWITKNITVLQTNTVKFIICLNFKIFNESAMKFRNVQYQVQHHV